MALWPAAYEKPHLQVGYMAAPTSNCRMLKQTLANGEPSIHGPKWTCRTHRHVGSFAPSSSHQGHICHSLKADITETSEVPDCFRKLRSGGLHAFTARNSLAPNASDAGQEDVLAMKNSNRHGSQRFPWRGGTKAPDSSPKASTGALSLTQGRTTAPRPFLASVVTVGSESCGSIGRYPYTAKEGDVAQVRVGQCKVNWRQVA